MKLLLKHKLVKGRFKKKKEKKKNGFFALLSDLILKEQSYEKVTPEKIM